MSSVVNRIGNAMPRWARRLVLDRLGGARLVGWIASGSVVEVALTDDVSIWANPVYHDGMFKDGRVVYEDNFTALLNDRVGAGAVFYDVGANIGVFAFLAALRVGSNGAVIAFEPEPNNVVCIRRSVADVAGRLPITLFEVAVSDKDGVVTFDRRGGAFSGRVATGDGLDGGQGATLSVPSISIDSLVQSGGAPPPTVIKIDVEGGEGGVMGGARATIDMHRPEILLEMHHFAKQGVDLAYSVLDQFGYRLLCADNYRAGEPAENLPEIAFEDRANVRHVLALPRSAEAIGAKA